MEKGKATQPEIIGGRTRVTEEQTLLEVERTPTVEEARVEREMEMD